jgi:hypothetical protein
MRSSRSTNPRFDQALHIYISELHIYISESQPLTARSNSGESQLLSNIYISLFIICESSWFLSGWYYWHSTARKRDQYSQEAVSPCNHRAQGGVWDIKGMHILRVHYCTRFWVLIGFVLAEICVAVFFSPLYFGHGVCVFSLKCDNKPNDSWDICFRLLSRSAFSLASLSFVLFSLTLVAVLVCRGAILCLNTVAAELCRARYINRYYIYE